MSKSIKVKLLNDGGFEGFDKFNYHAVLEGTPFVCSGKLAGVDILVEALIGAGAASNVLELAGCKAEAEGRVLFFSARTKEFEIVED